MTRHRSQPPALPADEPQVDSQFPVRAGDPHGSGRLQTPEPLDPQIQSIQPGGGVCMHIELAWGRLRRAYLKTFRRGYVRRMAARRRGRHNACPHDVLDPRDVKYYVNQGGYHWREEDDPFRWRDRIPFARAGLAELLLLGGGSAALSAAALWAVPYLAVPPAICCLLIVWFFRDPPRRVPAEAQVVVAPADGVVASIEQVEHDALVGGPAVAIGIFLSIFDVHINRAPLAARVIRLTYRHGKFLNALNSASARENQQLTICLREETPPYRNVIVRQISGAIARRIVCRLQPGERLERGEKFGMIKLGSRTELRLPREDELQLMVRVGERVKAGSTVLARYAGPQPREPS